MNLFYSIISSCCLASSQKEKHDAEESHVHHQTFKNITVQPKIRQEM